MSGLDWPGLLRAGLQGLRLTPDQFWRLTPGELFLMLGSGGDGGRLDRAQLDHLMAQFPDIAKGQESD